MPKKRYLNIDRGGYYQLRPDRTSMVNGTVITEEAKFIRFQNHVYETADPEEQKLIEQMPDFKNGKITIDQFKGEATPAPVSAGPGYSRGAATSTHMQGKNLPKAGQPKAPVITDEEE